jgi:hypothetical protein
MFGNGSIRDPKGYEQMLNIYGKTTSMEINATKLTITCNRFQPLQITDHRNFTTIQRTTFSCGYEYLGLRLNEMNMVSRIGCVYTRRFKKRLVMWCKKCLFLGGILTLAPEALCFRRYNLYNIGFWNHPEMSHCWIFAIKNVL